MEDIFVKYFNIVHFETALANFIMMESKNIASILIMFDIMVSVIYFIQGHSKLL